MRAWQLIGREQVELQELPVPEPGPGQVLLKVMACSICSRTDLVYYKYCGIKPHCRPGGHFGHEVSGTIEQLGHGVTELEVGQRVFLRFPGKPGGLAEYCLADPVAVGRLPDHMSFLEGAPAQQVPIAVNATRTLRLGDHVVIIGAGSAGLQILQMAKLRGAGRILVADLQDSRLRIARELGADVTVNARHESVLEAIREAFPSPPDICYDAVGTHTVVHQCVEAVRHEGIVCIFGTHHVEEHVSFDLVQWESKALTVHMANEGSDHTRREAMRVSERLLAAGHCETRPYITHVFPLADLPQAIDLLQDSPILFPEGDPAAANLPDRQALKVVIQVSPGAELNASGGVFTPVGPLAG
jgi:threonine dehydrogenase-like Zn-dependent dehydrogenase